MDKRVEQLYPITSKSSWEDYERMNNFIYEKVRSGVISVYGLDSEKPWEDMSLRIINWSTPNLAKGFEKYITMSDTERSENGKLAIKELKDDLRDYVEGEYYPELQRLLAEGKLKQYEEVTGARLTPEAVEEFKISRLVPIEIRRLEDEVAPFKELEKMSKEELGIKISQMEMDILEEREFVEPWMIAQSTRTLNILKRYREHKLEFSFES